MTFFESLLALLLAAIVLLQVSRRLALPYPAMLAAAGMAVALIPGAPAIDIEPHTALALFIAPALVDAAFDFPLNTARRFWAPLVTFAVGGVLVTTALVAWLGWMYAGLPIAAAVALGAIVAPPDAAAAAAVFSGLAIPRSSEAVLKGESLFNDATALLLFGGAVAVQSAGGLDTSVALHLGAAAPGGVLLGIAFAYLMRSINRFVTGTLGGNLLQFVNSFLVWIVAERLGLSAVLCVVAMAMTLARTGGESSPRMRVHSFAVWSAVVFVLNVMAFLLMGMQARGIVGRMPPAHLYQAAWFAAMVLGAIVLLRMVFVFGFNRWSHYHHRRRGEEPLASAAQGVLVGWAGMRGLVTLATAFALPPGFPQRDVVVLTAFAVVIGTLVAQGLTLAPLIRLLGLDTQDDAADDLARARVEIAQAALETLDGEEGPEATLLRDAYAIDRDAADRCADMAPAERRRRLGLAAVAAQRRKLDALRGEHRVGADDYNLLQEEIDWRELTILPEEERRIVES